MASQLTILPIIVQPEQGELFSSWLFRLATSNYSKVHTFCRFHFPGHSIWNRDIDRVVPDVIIKRLEILTEIPYQTLFELTLRSYEKNLFDVANSNTRQRWVLPLGIYHRTWRSFGLQFCPGCISKDKVPHFRKSWRLAISVICTKCQILLLDRCPDCSSPITFFRTDVGFKISIAPKEITSCPICDFDLRHSPRYPSMIGTIGFQSKINRVIQTYKWRNYYPSFEYFNVLYQIIKILKSESKFYTSFKQVIMNCEDLRISQLPIGHDIEKVDTVQREQLIRIGSWILEEWPNRFVSLCKVSKLSTSAVLKDNKYLPSWFISEATNNLHQPSAIDLNLNRLKK